VLFHALNLDELAVFYIGVYTATVDTHDAV